MKMIQQTPAASWACTKLSGRDKKVSYPDHCKNSSTAYCLNEINRLIMILTVNKELGRISGHKRGEKRDNVT
jgi:hypothetical protein